MLSPYSLVIYCQKDDLTTYKQSMSDMAALVLILAAGECGRRRRRGSSSQHLDMAPVPDYSLAKETGSLYT